MLFSNIIITDPVEKFELVFVVICLLSDACTHCQNPSPPCLAHPWAGQQQHGSSLRKHFNMVLKQRNGTQEATVQERNKKSRSSDSEDSRRAFDLFDPSRELGSLKPSVLNFIWLGPGYVVISSRVFLKTIFLDYNHRFWIYGATGWVEPTKKFSAL